MFNIPHSFVPWYQGKHFNDLLPCSQLLFTLWSITSLPFPIWYYIKLLETTIPIEINRMVYLVFDLWCIQVTLLNPTVAQNKFLIVLASFWNSSLGKCVNENVNAFTVQGMYLPSFNYIFSSSLWQGYN